MSTNEREPDLAALVAERDRPTPRHPAELTSDRIQDHLLRFDEHLTPAEVAALRLSSMALKQVPAREAAARRAGVDRA